MIIITSSPVIAGGLTYLYSDPGDIPLYKALSDQLDVSLSEYPSGNIILALDLNYNFMNESSRKALLTLFREAKAGKTIIIGLNTLRSLDIETPETLKLLGISINFTKAGIRIIEPENGFEFNPFEYDSDIYGIARINARSGEILLESSGIPVLIEIPLGKGRLVILAINPSDYYLNTKNQAVVDFIVAIVKHYSETDFPLNHVVVLGLVGITVVYLVTSNNPYVEKIRNWIKLIPIAIGRFMIPPTDVLKNGTRKAIYNYVKAKGYTTIQEVASAFSISRTNARWHLSVLKRAELIDETSVGNTVVFHLPGEGNKKKAIWEFILENKTRREVHKLLKEGKSLSEIARILRISKSTVHYNIKILREYGLIGEEK